MLQESKSATKADRTQPSPLYSSFLMNGVEVGNRKVILTKWMLLIFTVVTACFLILIATGENAQDLSGMYLNFVIGLGSISGAFTVGNVFEHRAGTAKARLQSSKPTANLPRPIQLGRFNDPASAQ